MIVIAFTPEEFSALTLALEVYHHHCREIRRTYQQDVDIADDSLAAIYARREQVVAKMQDTVLKARAS